MKQSIKQPTTHSTTQEFEQSMNWSNIQPISLPINQLIKWPINHPFWSMVKKSKDQLINQSIRQSINQSVNQSINQSNNQPINQPITRTIFNQSINKSIRQAIGQLLNQRINQSINQLSIFFGQTSNQTIH